MNEIHPPSPAGNLYTQFCMYGGLTGVFADSYDYQTHRQQGENPSYADQNSRVNVESFYAPPSRENRPQRFDGVSQRHGVGDAPEVKRHAFNRPAHSADNRER
jgi:hypothetical protein